MKGVGGFKAKVKIIKRKDKKEKEGQEKIYVEQLRIKKFTYRVLDFLCVSFATQELCKLEMSTCRNCTAGF
jgi:hypothetical protein